jgi:hypothetical protein
MRLTSLTLLRHPIRGFTYDLDDLPEGKLKHAVAMEVGPGTLPDHGAGFARVIQHVAHGHRVIVPGHTAPPLPPGLPL